MAGKISGLSEVVKKLHELQCCARCVLRYIGVQDGAWLYAKPYQELVKHVQTEYGASLSAECGTLSTFGDNHVICIACLGLLQDHSTSTLVKQICDVVQSSEHEYFSFTMSVNFPLVLNFRHHSLWLYLQENFSSIYPEQIKFGGILRLKDCLKFVYGPRMEESLDVEFNKMSTFSINVTLKHFEAMKELDFLLTVKKDFRHPPRKRKKSCAGNEPIITFGQVSKCTEGLKTCEEFNRLGQCPPHVVKTHCEVTNVECTNASVYLAGRYNKYSRTLSQSPWFVNEERMTETSVEELIASEIKKVFMPDDTKFSTAGREDVDVRMLGKGRPFILELINPRKVAQNAEQINEIQARVNGSTSDIQIKDLQKIKREDCSKLKEAENSKTKTYSALVYVPEGVTDYELKPLNDLKNVTLNQKTPMRVLHRRPLADRQRTILSMSTEYIDNNHFRLQLCTEAGTYIKEFVHGDFGRTKPNLTTILKKETDILELDVESVDVDWPPHADT